MAGVGRSEEERAREKALRFDTSRISLVTWDCKAADSYYCTDTSLLPQE